MKKLLFALYITVFLCTSLLADEQIAGFDEQRDLPILNEELRKASDEQDSQDTRITTLEAQTTGKVIQVVTNIDDTTFGKAENLAWGILDTGSTLIPIDDSKPQKTEGDQYMKKAIIPTSATNILDIEVVIVISHNPKGYETVALFQDDGADAIAAVCEGISDAAYMATVPLSFSMLAGATASTTFRVRAGNNNAGTTTFNGANGGQKFDGIAASMIKITEREP